jgi:hypothetical protein
MNDIQVLKRMALELVKAEALDKLLLIAYLETKNYAELNRSQPGGDWNIGLKSLSSEELIDDDEKNTRYKAITFFVKDYKVKLGGYRFRSTNPAELKFFEKIKFFLFEEVILDLDYELLRDPKGIADYQFKNIEEFHKDDRTKIVLENIYKLILEKQAREEEAKKNIVVKKTRDKFTF